MGKPAAKAEDEATFVLPMYGLFADLESGLGLVRLADDFENASSAVQLEVLAGWRRDLNERWKLTLVKLFNDVSKTMPGISRDTRIRRFRATCASLEIECPDDLDALLA